MQDVRDTSTEAGVRPCRWLAPELTELSDDQVTAGYDQLLADTRRAARALVAVEAEIDARQMWRQDGTTSLDAWIAMRAGEGGRAARQHAFVATRLGELPRLRDALADGTLSFAHIHHLLVLATLTGLDDDDLYSLGVDHTVAQLETACRAARRLHPDSGHEQHRRRSLTWRTDGHGTVHLRRRLTAVDGLTVTTLLAAMAAEAPRNPVTGHSDPFHARAADALVDLCTAPDGTPGDRPTVIIHATTNSLTTTHSPNGGPGKTPHPPTDTGDACTGTGDSNSDGPCGPDDLDDPDFDDPDVTTCPTSMTVRGEAAGRTPTVP